jgi:hypothetical protein
MNVTPLVDVVLVLLIVFMVITPLLAKQFWVHIPNEPDPAEPPAEAQESARSSSMPRTTRSTDTRSRRWICRGPVGRRPSPSSLRGSPPSNLVYARTHNVRRARVVAPAIRQ